MEQVHTAPGVGRGLRRARTSPPPVPRGLAGRQGQRARGGGGSRLTQEGGPGSRESLGLSDDPLVGMVRGSVVREACWGGCRSDQRGRGLGGGHLLGWEGGAMGGQEGGKRPRAATQKHRTRGHTHPWAIGLPAPLVSHPQQERGIQHTIPNPPPQ